MQRSKRGSVGAGRVCSPFVASALLKLEGEPCLQAQEKIEQCQQPVLGFFLHFSHSPDPDEGVQHKEQASNQSIEQHHQLHPGPVPLPFSRTAGARRFLRNLGSCLGNHCKACTPQARRSLLFHLHKGAHYNKKATALPLPQTSWKLFKGKKKKKNPHASKLEWFAVLSAALTVLKWGRKGFLYVPSLSSPQGLKAREISVLHSSHPSASNAHCSYLTDSQKGTKCKKHYEFELSLLKLPLCYWGCKTLFTHPSPPKKL